MLDNIIVPVYYDYVNRRKKTMTKTEQIKKAAELRKELKGIISNPEATVQYFMNNWGYSREKAENETLKKVSFISATIKVYEA